jgi:hypothetical protein
MPRVWWDRKQPAFHDAAFQRAVLPIWDERWSRLSPAARQYLLTKVQATSRRNQRQTAQPFVSAQRFPADVLDELTAKGFVIVRPSSGREMGPQAALAEEAVDCLQRMRGLRRYHLLDACQPSEFTKYVNYCFIKYELTNELHRILRKAGLDLYSLFGDVFEMYVMRRHWPDWVAEYLGDSLAESILQVIEQAGGRLPMAEIAGRLPGHSPAEVRAALEKLITRLALVEDLDPETYKLQVGVLPSVQEDREQARRPRQRPALQPVPPPPEPGPEGGLEVPDLRAVLLEVAGGRARLRQDRILFQKESERFEAVLDPLPAWLVTLYNLTPPQRLERALNWASILRLTGEKKEGDRLWLDLNEHGRRWLGQRVEEQYAAVFEAMRDPERPDDSYSYWSHDFDDGWFLGSPMSAVPRRGNEDGRRPLTLKDRLPLREALHAAFRELPVGIFHRLDNFVAHAVFGPHNPLLLGRSLDEVQVHASGRPLAPLEEQFEQVARHLFALLASNRLILLGCLQVGQDADGELLIARRPRLDVYFGHEATAAEAAGPGAASRVVVQPDYSVIVIGIDLAPLAELAPFCERSKERSGAGAVTLRITRASIVRAVTAGLSGEEILERLRRHSSTPVPDNVAHEVREWAGWVRQVSAEPVLLFRCPDAAAADRLAAALGGRAEKLSDTVIASTSTTLGDADRRKLLEQGILVRREALGAAPKNRGTRGRRR